MSSEWEYAPLSEVCSRITYGFTNPMPTIDGEGAYMVTAKDIKNGRIQYQTARKTSWDAYRDKLTDKSRPSKGDLLLTKDGSIGRLALCDRDDICINQSVALLQSNGKGDFRYIKYLLEAPEYQRKMESDSDGSTIKHIYITRVDKMMIPLPPRKEQEGIVSILGTLDDKIELNRKTNETLEAIAKALFKSWFVDFDPVRAKAEGRPTGLPAEISDLFPDTFEDSELGEIPSGWSVSEIDQILSLQKDSLDPATAPDEAFDHYSIPAFDAGKYPAKELGSSIKSQKFLVGDGDLLVSKLNPSTPRVWIPFASSDRRAICSTEFLVCRTSSVFGRAYAYCLASSDAIVEAMAGLAGGTSNSHQRIRPGDFLALPCCIGTEMVRSAFLGVVEPLLSKSLVLRTESRSLSTTRDALLPKLISGELRIPDAEKLLESVL